MIHCVKWGPWPQKNEKFEGGTPSQNCHCLLRIHQKAASIIDFVSYQITLVTCLIHQHNNSVYLVWPTNQTVLSTSLLDDITYQVLLSIVGGQDGNLLRGITDHPHVHEHGHDIFRFSQVLSHVNSPDSSRIILTNDFRCNETKVWKQ